MAVSPALFLIAIQSALRVGRAGMLAHQDRLRSADISLLMPSIPDVPGGPQAMALQFIWTSPDMKRDFAHLFDTREGTPRLSGEVTQAQIAAAIVAVHERIELEQNFVQQSAGEGVVAISTASVVTLKSWYDSDHPNRRYARLGRELLDATFSIIAAEPSITGLKGNALKIVGALSENLAELIPDDDPVGPNDPRSFGERAAKIFVTATLETVVERPELVLPKAHMAAFARSVLQPLHEEVKADQTRLLPSLQRLRTLVRGPMAQGALQALHEHEASFLTGRFGGDKLAGAVARSVIGSLAARPTDGFDLRRIISEESSSVVLTAALDVAQRRPELFIRGDGHEVEAARSFLQKVAGAMENAPRPFDWRGGLGPQIAALGFEVAADYARVRLMEGASEEPWSQAGAAVAAHLVEEILLGFSSVVGMAKEERAAAGAINPFERLFDREQAIDILRIIATYAAETPGMIVGDRAKPEVQAIAKSIAECIVADESGLLRPEDWRIVISTALSEAAKNPGALFGINEEASPENQIAAHLIKGVLSRASENMANGERAPGRLLFGETLREALT
ncbi:MAG: hypothetical protein AB7O04_12850, partial [Hyphomonadaceae bacterium]